MRSVLRLRSVNEQAPINCMWDGSYIEFDSVDGNEPSVIKRNINDINNGDLSKGESNE